MNDKDIMENLILTEKSACDLYLHGVIESSDPKIRCAFRDALDKSLQMQSAIYKKMEQKGFYTSQSAEQQKINQTKSKFASS